MEKVKNIGFLRLVSKILPLKTKLNFLIKDYIIGSKKIVIPYGYNYAIVTTPEVIAESTLNHLIFEGARYLPEYELLHTIKQKLDNEFIWVDVGANIGTLIWQLADKCKYVHAFEPMPRLNNIIQNSAEYNQFEKLILYNKAVGCTPGSVLMMDNDNSSVLDGNSTQEGINIEITTLDIELQNVEKIDFIKIDVEGFELEVLKGAVGQLHKHKPLLLVELHPRFLKNYGVDYMAVLDFLEQHNYTIHYYSFLEEARLSRVSRFFSRYFPHRGKRFRNRETFIQDVETIPAKLSYHLFCEYKRV